FACQTESQKQEASEEYALGEINLKVTGNNEAQEYFEKGLLLLHSFEYKDAQEAFEKARKADPDMGMAYWGEAMTYNHSLWREQDYEAARAILEKWEEQKASSKLSKLEQDFLKAVNILYQKESPKEERDQAYAKFMKELYEKYPKNQEVGAFYALSLLGSVPDGRDDQIFEQGALIAKGIMAENPQHPGALHYLIHSYDDPGHAKLALEAANNYSKVAPDAAHALHMPSHIYVALGMWEEVVTSNIRSYEASLNRMKAKELGNEGRSYHAYHWLEYGYLQQGEQEKARKMLEAMQEYTQENPSKYARTHLVYLKGTYLMESNDWESPLADIEIEVSDLNVATRAQYHFQNGMRAYQAGDAEALDAIIETLSEDYKKEELLVHSQDILLCSGTNRESASESNIKSAEAREWQLRALLAWLNKDEETAEKWLRKAVAREESLSYSYGPPRFQKPTRELYAEWLLEHDQAKLALEQYEFALKRGPKRRMALLGIKKAAEKLENQEKVKEVERQLEEIKPKKDHQLKEI
ncbi:MAG: hypothetical protein AAFU64_06350, partial [Bacteroidota bacterium]